MSEAISLIEATQMHDKHPEFNSGDTITVHYRVIEGEKERIQLFQGVVINIRGAGASKTFMVRKISGNVGVERIFPFYTPKIAKIEVVRHGRVRRSKLFYLRELRGKAARIREKRHVR